MINETYKYSDITGAVIGCAMRVHTKLGHGFPEVIYQRALAIELDKILMPYVREKEWEVYYDALLIGKRRVDFVVMEKVLVELKAIGSFEPGNYTQILNYLEAFKMEIGLLLNFGKKSLEFKRFTKNR
ncbi:GxxExxY protein [Foetidibacter luteolus]|uniref:GxxExxY protein n=1 Tax=Foetidibacter luteolus TaxID=2608880 RepID=UPI00129AD59E|nr:GxxExxY protein [Foetidibacter luteolus]